MVITKNQKSLQVILFASQKGGSGKSTGAILTANNLAARGYKVLFFDMDETSFSGTGYYTAGMNNIQEIITTKNIFEAISHNDIGDNIINSRVNNVDIVPASFDCDKIRSIGFFELKKTLDGKVDDYDYIVIDSKPSYDNLLINEIQISDIILTPFQYDSYNLNATSHLETKFYDELPNKIDNWYIYPSFHKSYYERFENSVQTQFQKEFENVYGNRLLDIHIPDTQSAKNYTQTADCVLKTDSGETSRKKLAVEINRLVNMITNKDPDDTSAYTKEF